MTDIPVFIIANLHVEDAAEYRRYEKGFFPILKKYGGTFLTYDDAPVTFEGFTPPKGRLILFQFPSDVNARNWFNDADYQALSEHRRAGAPLQFLTMVHGLPPRES